MPLLEGTLLGKSRNWRQETSPYFLRCCTIHFVSIHMTWGGRLSLRKNFFTHNVCLRGSSVNAAAPATLFSLELGLPIKRGAKALTLFYGLHRRSAQQLRQASIVAKWQSYCLTLLIFVRKACPIPLLFYYCFYLKWGGVLGNNKMLATMIK